MINVYTIHNFKNHADTVLNLGNLTILTGINGAGKSSVMQSMLALRESFLRDPQLRSLRLDGESFNIGRSSELINRTVTESPDMLSILLSSGSDNFIFQFKYPMTDSSELAVNAPLSASAIEELLQMPLFSNNFQFLSAFRNGPRQQYDSNPSVVDFRRQISSRMGMGEYAVYFLSQYQDEEIPIVALKHAHSVSNTLRAQTEAWMSEISNGIRFQLEQNGNTYNIKYGYERQNKTMQYHSAMNTGFGISYVLSIIIAVLSAKPGSLLLIENPEAHIHPSGQSALMRLISLATENGVQIILETHSDHIINGALVTYKKNHFDTNNLKIYYFERDEDFNANPIPLTIAEDGVIKGAPEGFFDQMEMDLEVLYEL